MYPSPTHSEYYEQKEAEEKSNDDNNWSKKKQKEKATKRKILFCMCSKWPQSVGWQCVQFARNFKSWTLMKAFCAHAAEGQ